jgi:hypothetical protein
MAASEKQGYGLVAVGFVFLGVGLTFLAADHFGVGVSILVTSAILLMAGSTILRRKNP